MLRIPYDVLRSVWETKPELLWSVVRLLSQRIRSTDEALADAFFLDVTGRTAKHLLELAGDADEFEIPITQEELAGLVGASRERVNKAIASFLRLGLDRAERPLVPDPQASRARDPLAVAAPRRSARQEAEHPRPRVRRVVGSVRGPVGSCTKPWSAPS